MNFAYKGKEREVNLSVLVHTWHRDFLAALDYLGGTLLKVIIGRQLFQKS